MSKAYKIAKRYYPIYWTKQALKNLVNAEKLTKNEYKELTGEEYI